MNDKVHDVIHLLSEKLDMIWRYDKYMEDRAGDSLCRDMFQQFKEDELRHVQMLRDEIERLCREGAFR